MENLENLAILRKKKIRKVGKLCKLDYLNEKMPLQ
ncbi:hypothetical protein predicted by Glimmer/Critica [Listeria monocytogenes serotype 7 str. SLCC2482]|nr:hypothetical protein predicted by Glimmer/Critica [Listeria monocytogenes serotype 7 str. SLCC2482]CBY49799.1 hypothetical protein LMOSLCC2755_2207 [Listeria monocytogenes SLCC2755]CBY64128.1 hypothetical protein LMOSLCC2376_2096 [Listeria monocytogenes SLCC2376]CBY68236.1 hypothetical protein LMOL312_2158 [Listeria monocytogenes L312]CBY71063.1 hypothetical protein LMOATCC19117_2164 [Listeria monocytogenes ATCC 19117]CBY73937.1 hypothetical protein LMOSLCC2378_2170 [Listeria monocytogenes 